MDDDKRKLAFESITNCQDINQFQKIKFRLDQFQKIVKQEPDLFNEIAEAVKPDLPLMEKPGIKPDPELTKQLNKLNKKMKSNV
jgi:hypothetical protein